MADILPGFSYSTSLRRYRDQSTGRFVSKNAVMDLLDSHVQSTERRLGNLTAAFHEGNVSPSWWAEQMRTELRRAHLQNRALGAGGIDKLTAADYGSVGRKLRDDYARIADLARGIANGEVTLPQAMNRINGYVGNARIEYWEAERNAAKPSDSEHALIEKRRLGNAEHCQDCVGYYAQGWQPQGALPVPGQGSICSTHCRCTLLSREVPIGELGEWIGSGR